MSVDYLLHENPVGYAVGTPKLCAKLYSCSDSNSSPQVFKVVAQPDTIGNRLKEVQAATQDLDKFGKMVELVGLAPFQGTQDALQGT
jgi:nucleolar protein 56